MSTSSITPNSSALPPTTPVEPTPASAPALAPQACATDGDDDGDDQVGQVRAATPPGVGEIVDQDV